MYPRIVQIENDAVIPPTCAICQQAWHDSALQHVNTKVKVQLWDNTFTVLVHSACVSACTTPKDSDVYLLKELGYTKVHDCPPEVPRVGADGNPVTESHTVDCWATIEELRDARKDYKQKYPHHCPHCEGWGETYVTEDFAPWGESGWYQQTSEPCPLCIDVSQCPRCGADNDWDEDLDSMDDLECADCGWKWDDEDSPGLPEPAECSCWGD